MSIHDQHIIELISITRSELVAAVIRRDMAVKAYHSAYAFAANPELGNSITKATAMLSAEIARYNAEQAANAVIHAYIRAKAVAEHHPIITSHYHQ